MDTNYISLQLLTLDSYKNQSCIYDNGIYMYTTQIFSSTNTWLKNGAKVVHRRNNDKIR